MFAMTRFEHDSKQPEPKDVRRGKYTLVRLVQEVKAPAPKLDKRGLLTDVTPLQD
jgi:hypothetical protein